MNEEILSELKEQTKWLKFLALPSIKKIVEENIITPEQKRIYMLSDGKNSTKTISNKLLAEGLKASHMTVYNYWKKWLVSGLVIPSKKYSGRFERIISLDDYNIKK